MTRLYRGAGAGDMAGSNSLLHQPAQKITGPAEVQSCTFGWISPIILLVFAQVPGECRFLMVFLRDGKRSCPE